jgi:hypothetical protein
MVILDSSGISQSVWIEILTEVVIKGSVFWERRVVRWKSTDVSEENIASNFSVE